MRRETRDSEAPSSTAGASPGTNGAGSSGSSSRSLPHSPWLLYTTRQRCGFLTILFLVCACNFFDYSVLSIVLDPIKREFNVSDTQLGFLSGLCFSVTYALAGLPIARWADRGNRRTVITVALTVWSIATALCGVSQSFWQLALARLGLGLAEPGAIPPAQSLIADFFPPGKRATPIAILSQVGSAVGWLAGVGLGGYLAAAFGWRQVFVLAGGVGIGLALLVRIRLPEPRSQIGFPQMGAKSEGATRAFGQLLRKPAFVLLLVGASSYAVFSYGVTTFLPSFMMRSLNATLAQVSVVWGTAISVASLLGALMGGWLGDRLSARDVRWYSWLPAIACIVALPIYGWALNARSLDVFIEREFVAELLLGIGMPSVYAALHVVCGNTRRAIAVATMTLAFTLFGSGFGPLIAGWTSDLLAPQWATESLRYALMIMLLFIVPAAAAFYFAARAIRLDAED